MPNSTSTYQTQRSPSVSCHVSASFANTKHFLLYKARVFPTACNQIYPRLFREVIVQASQSRFKNKSITMIYHVHFDQKRIEKVVLNRVKELCLQRTRSMLRALQPRVFLSKLEHGSAALRWYSINATTVTEPSTSPAQLLLQRFSVPLSLSPSLPLSLSRTCWQVCSCFWSEAIQGWSEFFHVFIKRIDGPRLSHAATNWAGSRFNDEVSGDESSPLNIPQ